MKYELSTNIKWEFGARDLMNGYNEADLYEEGEFIADYIEQKKWEYEYMSLFDVENWTAVGKLYKNGEVVPGVTTLEFRIEVPEDDEFPFEWSTGQIFRLPWKEYYLG